MTLFVVRLLVVCGVECELGFLVGPGGGQGGLVAIAWTYANSVNCGYGLSTRSAVNVRFVFTRPFAQVSGC